jgi:hypothetical protein
MMKVKQ